TVIVTTTYAAVNSLEFTYFSNVQQVTAANASPGDMAFLFDDAGNNTLTATPTSPTLVNTGLNLTLAANGYPQVRAFAATGTDTAERLDSAGVDEFVGTLSEGYLTGTAVGFLNLVSGFRTVIATSSSPGDFALLFDAVGSNDTFTAAPTSATLSGTLNGTGYANRVDGFAQVRASVSGSGTANLSDSAGDHTLPRFPPLPLPAATNAAH